MGILQDAIGSNLAEVFKSVVGEFHLSKEDQAKFQQAIDENKKEIDLAQIELESKVQDGISSEVKASIAAYQAEQTGDDGYTKHWRPTFGYMVILLLFWNYAIVPLLGKQPVVLPTQLFEMFGALLLVAIGGRSFEKIFGGKP